MTRKEFDTHLPQLEELFPNKIIEQEKDRLWSELQKTESAWTENLKRYKGKDIKFLLICEAPLDYNRYFYNDWKHPLVTKVWNTFFSNSKPKSGNIGYQCLADIGFLLIDSLPYSKNYGRHRYNPQYYKLVEACIPWWLNKLGQLPLDSKLKIAFGFNQNALNIMISLLLRKGNHSLKSYLPFTPDLVAQDSAGQPNTKRLEAIYKTTGSKIVCP